MKYNNQKKTACVDLDGTLAKYDGWKGIHDIGDPYPAAKDFMSRLYEKYYLIIRCAVLYQLKAGFFLYITMNV